MNNFFFGEFFLEFGSLMGRGGKTFRLIIIPQNDSDNLCTNKVMKHAGIRIN